MPSMSLFVWGIFALRHKIWPQENLYPSAFLEALFPSKNFWPIPSHFGRFVTALKWQVSLFVYSNIFHCTFHVIQLQPINTRTHRFSSSFNACDYSSDCHAVQTWKLSSLFFHTTEEIPEKRNNNNKKKKIRGAPALQKTAS